MSNEITDVPADSSLPNSQVPNSEPNAETLATENDELKAQIAAVEAKQAETVAVTPLAAENVALKAQLAELQNAPSVATVGPTTVAPAIPEQHPSEALPTPVVNEPGLQPTGEGLPEAAK